MDVRDLVVPIDFSECSRVAMERAHALASRYGARVHLLHAVSPLPYPPEFGYGTQILEDLEERARRLLARAARELRGRGADVAEHLVVGPAVEAIVRLATDVDAQLVVMGTHGHSGVKQLFLGSVAARTLRVAPCPVWTCRGTDATHAEPVQRVLVPTDFSAHAGHALDVAISLCADLGAELDLIHVYHSPLPLFAEIPTRAQLERGYRDAAERKLAEAAERVRRGDVHGAATFRTGPPAAEIADCAAQHGSDLVVLGTRGHRGLRRAFLGSVAEHVLRSAPCSVLTVTHDPSGEGDTRGRHR